ncbi:MAG TPA: response regulator [Candidatus Krumholzibacteria bacterium]|nr:response regulator [Candidatus Krumholzibacteria bacterium]
MSLAHDGDTHTILVVDDDELSRHVVACRLTRWGWRPVVFASPDAALQYLQHHDACALVTDLEMPGRDGLSLASDVRRLHAELPVLLLTARPDQEVVRRAREAGVVAVIGKQAGSGHDLRLALSRALAPAKEGDAESAAAPEPVLARPPRPSLVRPELTTDFELAHSLRTPLTALKSAIDILCAGGLHESHHRFAGIAQRNVDQMIVLVERLLDRSAARP